MKSIKRHHYEGFGMALIRLLRYRRNGARITDDRIEGLKGAMYSMGVKCGMSPQQIKRDMRTISQEIR